MRGEREHHLPEHSANNATCVSQNSRPACPSRSRARTILDITRAHIPAYSIILAVGTPSPSTNHRSPRLPFPRTQSPTQQPHQTTTAGNKQAMSHSASPRLAPRRSTSGCRRARACRCRCAPTGHARGSSSRWRWGRWPAMAERAISQAGFAQAGRGVQAAHTDGCSENYFTTSQVGYLLAEVMAS